MRQPSVALVAVMLAVSLLAGGVALSSLGGAGIVTASHGGPGDLTIEPIDAPDDRRPGASTARYGLIGVVDRDIDQWETLIATYEEGDFSECGPQNADKFGIDRGNTHDGYETDEDLQQYVKSFSSSEDRLEVQFNREDDFGPTPYLEAGDAVITLAECYGNPDEPGWYQIEGRMSGKMDDGSEVTYEASSHYFWICDCENEQEAREQLGPPPSEQGNAQSTETPGSDSGTDAEATEEATETPDKSSADNGEGGGGGGGETDTGATGGAEATDSGSETTADGSSGDAVTDEASGGGNGGESADAGEKTEEAEEWDEIVHQTPTASGEGGGFGGALAILSLLGASLLAFRPNR